MTQRHYAMAALELNNVIYPGVGTSVYEPDNEVQSPTTDGASDEIFHSVQRLSPRVDITTLGITELVDALVLDPAENPPFLALDGINGLQIVGRLQATDGPTIAAGSVHEQLQIIRGLIYLTGISGTIGQPISLTARTLARTDDGDVDPVTLTEVAAPTEPDVILPYILDSILINAIEDDAVQGFDYTIDANERFEHGPNIYPTFVAVGQGRPVRHRIAITTDDQAQQRLIGNAGSEKQIVITLRNMVQGGTRGVNTVTITTNNGLLVPRGRSDENEAKGTIPLEHMSRRDAATLPISIVKA